MKKTIAVILMAASMTFGLVATAEAQGRPEDKGPTVERAISACVNPDGTPGDWTEVDVYDPGHDAVYLGKWVCSLEAKLPKLKGACKSIGGGFIARGNGPYVYICHGIPYSG